MESIIVIHMAEKESLESKLYETFIQALEARFKNQCRLTHVILDERFYVNVIENTERDQIEY